MNTDRPGIEPTLFPRGVADPPGRVGYICNAAEGIDAIDLATGALLWSSAAGSRPLIVAGKRLAAMARVKAMPNVLQVVVLDVTQNGQLLQSAEPILLPPQIDLFAASAEEFKLHVQLADNDLLLSWEIRTSYRGGAPPSQETLQAETSDTAGSARVNLTSGKVTLQPFSPTAQTAAAQTFLPVTGEPYLRGGAQLSEPWSVDDHLAILILESAGKGSALQLQHWSVGENPALLQSFPLLEGAAFAAQVSLDGQHLLVHRDPLPKRDPNWHIFAAETGQLIAKTPSEPETQEVQLLGMRMFYTTATLQGKGRKAQSVQLALYARDLDTGEDLWQYPIEMRRTSPPAALRA